MKLKVIILFLLIFFLSPFLYATTNVSTKTKTEQLHKLIHSIKSLQKNIKITHSKKLTVEQQLRQSEIFVGNLTVALKTTKSKLAVGQKLLQQLYKKKIYYEKKLIVQQQNLARQIRAIYMLGKEPYIKLLLNNQDPAKFGRMFTYYYYLQQYRLTLISKINQILIGLHKNKLAIEQQTKKLLLLKQKQLTEFKTLIYIKQQRKGFLQLINGKLKTQTAKLDELQKNKKALEKVIAELESSTSVAFSTPLNKLKQKLHWPTKGKIAHLYGNKIANSQLEWNGVIIHAAEGQNVHAISSGKVVFAEWLRGYGLLLIINHGHGYMSLYGRNNSLYKKVGAVVRTGDLISTVGESGGYDMPGSYFAIRHNGKPVNPVLWCR